jgi:hypothetical protein
MLASHSMPKPCNKPSCQRCAAAHDDPDMGLFDMTCLSCVARHIALSPPAWHARRGGDRDELASSILKVWGGEKYAEGRAAVWSWLQRIEAHRSTR